jgi:glycosyltransferase involved in cell wall biosynthesis
MKIVIVSCKFSPGHTEHLCSFYNLFSEMGHDVVLCVDPMYKEALSGMEDVVFSKDQASVFSEKPDLVFVYNAAIANIKLAYYCKKRGIPFFYVLHEPNLSFKSLVLEKQKAPKMFAAGVVNSLTCLLSYKVLLASREGLGEYEKRMKCFNRNYDYFPLIFRDRYDFSKDYKREYFSFIGGFSPAHASKEFLQFVEYALKHRLHIKFLIATRHDIGTKLKVPTLEKGIRMGQIMVQYGRPLTEDEINGYYRRSICVWNAYNRSTQSGVLSNALMQGAPVIVNRSGVAKEFVHDGREGCYIPMPHDNEKIARKYDYILAHLKEMSQAARNSFRINSFYQNKKELAQRVIFGELI